MKRGIQDINIIHIIVVSTFYYFAAIGELWFSAIYLHFVYPSGKPRIHHLLCYQGLAVVDCGFALDAADLAHPRLSLN
jgi:hypothetical protein